MDSIKKDQWWQECREAEPSVTDDEALIVRAVLEINMELSPNSEGGITI